MQKKRHLPAGNSTDSKVVFYAGFFAEINAGNKFKFQPALNYVDIDKVSALQITIIIKYYIDPKFNLQFGPQFIFDLEKNLIPDYYNSTNFVLAFGAAH